ncbi:unnamed protein product [Amaranthus hypochondriacus]
MVDLNDKKSSDPDGEIKENEIKRCADCGTSKTPLWRGGPAGPKSLCNACGIRNRKKRRAILGLKTKGKKSKKINHNSSSSSRRFSSGCLLNQRLRMLGREVMMQRSTVDKQHRWNLGEEEEAAVLLMSLSYGCFYA